MTPDQALSWYGLTRPPSFRLQLAPTAWPPGAGLWFRAQLWAWCRGGPGIVYARAKRYISLVPDSIPVVLEAHEVDSELDREADRDPSAHLQLESKVLSRVKAVATNCSGTLQLLDAVHGPLPPSRVIHNGTRADRQVELHPSATPVVGYTGSPRRYKGLDTALASVSDWPVGVALELVGERPDWELPERVRWRQAVPYPQLPALLATYHALLLPLDDNLFGRHLTSPLKLWDYLATGLPVIAADLPTTREIGGERLYYYTPGDTGSLAAAVRRALDAGPGAPRLRTWDDRAAEIEALLQTVLVGGTGS